MEYETILLITITVIISLLFHLCMWYFSNREEYSKKTFTNNKDEIYPKEFYNAIEHLEKRIKNHKIVQDKVNKSFDDLDKFVCNVNKTEKENFPRIKNSYKELIYNEQINLENKLWRFKQFRNEVYKITKVITISDLYFNVNTESIYFKIKRKEFDLLIQYLKENGYRFITNEHLKTKREIKVRIGTHPPDDISSSKELQLLKEGKLIYSSLLIENKLGKSWI